MKEMLNAFNEIIYGIENGIVLPDGNVRNYDILDYYQNNYVNSVMEINKNFNLIKNEISYDDLRLFKKFIEKNPLGVNLNEYYIKQIFATRDEINTVKDKNGNFIPGTGRIITSEEKKLIFDYITDNNLPLTTKIYSLVFKRYIDGELDLKQEQKQSL